MKVTLEIQTPQGNRRIPLDGDRLTVGRTEPASLVIGDKGLSRVHASIHRDGDRVWVLDEGSTNGSFVNGLPVAASGTPLRDGDEISIGEATTILVRFGDAAREEQRTNATTPAVASPAHDNAAADADVTAEASAAAASSGAFAAAPQAPAPSTPAPIVAAIAGILIILIAAVTVAVNLSGGRGDGADDRVARRGDRNGSRTYTPQDGQGDSSNGAGDAQTSTQNTNAGQTTQTADASPSPAPSSASATPQTANTPAPVTLGTPPPVVTSRKLYLQMNEQEKLDFIEDRARHVSMMMGNRPYAFNDDVLRYIKQYVDGYARRVGNGSNRLWGEDLRFMFSRAREQYAPYISRAFNAHGVPPVVGLYLVVVETEYHNIQSENAAGAAGLFQFIGPTARGYGVEPSERTNVAKMAPAAASYMADRIAEFGPDSMSVALAIAGYNRSPDSVRRDLHDVLNSENKERSFWTLVANSNKLDHYFQGENIKYVPKFFAAAIVGENPWAFGLDMQPLSTYTEIKTPPEEAAAQK